MFKQRPLKRFKDRQSTQKLQKCIQQTVTEYTTLKQAITDSVQLSAFHGFEANRVTERNIQQAGRRLVRSLTNSIRHLCFHVYMH